MADLPPWPKLWHNLRASRQTELEERHPSHVVCAWLRNSDRKAPKPTENKGKNVSLLERKGRDRSKFRKPDGMGEAKLVKLACSTPPEVV